MAGGVPCRDGHVPGERRGRGVGEEGLRGDARARQGAGGAAGGAGVGSASVVRCVTVTASGSKRKLIDLQSSRHVTVRPVQLDCDCETAALGHHT